MAPPAETADKVMCDEVKTAVVIPVKDEEAGLPALIGILQEQMLPGDEAVFVDAGSRDGTLRILQEASRRDGRVRFLVAEGAFPGRGRNVAVRNTDADIIAHVDGGTLPAENWLAEITRPIRENRADYVSGNVRFLPIPGRIIGVPIDWADFYGASLFPSTSKGRSSKEPPAGGASVAYKRHVWEEAGGQPEWLRCGSDPIFVQKVLQQDIRIVFAEKAVLHWQIGPAFSDFLKRHYRDQMIRFRSYSHLRSGLGPVVAHLGFLVACLLGIRFPVFRPVAAVLGILMLIRRNLKSLQTYRLRTEKTWGRTALAEMVLLPLDTAALLTRVVSSLIGALTFRGEDVNWTRKIEQYLAGEISGAGEGASPGVSNVHRCRHDDGGS